jgi:hypothetical protein
LENKHDCKAVNHSDAFLIISNRRSLLIADLEQKSIERVPITVDNVVATNSDMNNSVIFWSDMDTKKIMKLKRGGGSPEAVVTSGLNLVEGLAYDWVAKKSLLVGLQVEHHRSGQHEWQQKADFGQSKHIATSRFGLRSCSRCQMALLDRLG